MGYEKRKIGEFDGVKAFVALMRLGHDMKGAQRLCDKGRIFDGEGRTLAKNDVVNGELWLVDYVCVPRGLAPIYECEAFAVYDKPSGLLSHPSGRHSPYNMYDEIWARYGREACVAHRLDAETSGVLVVARNYAAAKSLKSLFESRAVMKSYLAYARGKMDYSNLNVGGERGAIVPFEREKYAEFGEKLAFLEGFEGYVVDAPLAPSDDLDGLKIRMKVDDSGKRAVTLFRPLRYLPECDATLVECFPLTGRQHQIRVHLFHVEHAILGEPLYGLNRRQAEMILDGVLSREERIMMTGASRLMLHASEIKFELNGEFYDIRSQFKFELESNLK